MDSSRCAIEDIGVWDGWLRVQRRVLGLRV
jgi:hypothetical protein